MLSNERTSFDVNQSVFTDVIFNKERQIYTKETAVMST